MYVQHVRCKICSKNVRASKKKSEFMQSTRRAAKLLEKDEEDEKQKSKKYLRAKKSTWLRK